MDAIQTKGLCKHYPDFTLENIDLTLPHGCIMGLIGENGAGKSTLIKLLLGLVPADGGEAQVLGSDDVLNNCALKEHIGVVMEDCGFPENLTLTNVNAVLKRSYRTWDESRFLDYAKRFQLPGKKPIKDFSRGMRMKLSIAAALSHDSRLLLLDEATSGLDPIVRDEMLDVFLDFIQDEQNSILISSHIISDLEKACDYIAFMHKGRMLFIQPKDELLRAYVLAKAPAAELRALLPEAVVGVRESAFGAEALIRRDALPQGMAYEPATLEEIMLYHVKEVGQQ